MPLFIRRNARAKAVASCFLSAVVALPFEQSAAADLSSGASPWLAVDRNRGSIVTGIVKRFDEVTLSMRGQPGVLSEAQLRDALAKLRADQLFSASLAGTYSRLLEILTEAGAFTATTHGSKTNVKATNPELAYSAITPCRIVDTRLGGGGYLGDNATRNWNVSRPGGSFADQGGVAGDCGIAATPAAVMANIVATGSIAPGVVYAWPFGQAAPTASVLNYAGFETIANGVILPVAQGQASDLSVLVSSATDVIVDILGYFSPPSGGYVVSVAPSGAQYTSIQSAIDAASLLANSNQPYLVKVAPGTYTEQVILRDYVDVEGAGFGATVILSHNAPCTIATGASAVLRDVAIFNDHSGAFPNGAVGVLQSSNTANGFSWLRGVSIQTAGSNDNKGVLVNGGSLMIENSDVSAGDAFNPPPSAIAIGANNAGATVTVRDSRLFANATSGAQVANQSSGALIRMNNTRMNTGTSGGVQCISNYNSQWTPVTCN